MLRIPCTETKRTARTRAKKKLDTRTHAHYLTTHTQPHKDTTMFDKILSTVAYTADEIDHYIFQLQDMEELPEDLDPRQLPAIFHYISRLTASLHELGDSLADLEPGV